MIVHSLYSDLDIFIVGPERLARCLNIDGTWTRRVADDVSATRAFC
jgi:hypothetical protein